MARFGGLRLPAVVATVLVDDRRGGKLGIARVVEAGEVDGHEGPKPSSMPRPNGLMPQCRQKRWRMAWPAKRYSLSASSPATRRKEPAGTTCFQKRDLAQIEQLQRLVVSSRSRSAAKRIVPQ